MVMRLGAVYLAIIVLVAALLLIWSKFGQTAKAVPLTLQVVADDVMSKSITSLNDLFWWISYGIGEVMPPFSATLDDEARWNLIDFVRANADAAHLLERRQWSAMSAIRRQIFPPRVPTVRP